VERWGFGKRLAFCFAFAYFVLFHFPFPLDVIPGSERVFGPYSDLWTKLVLWVGPAVFGVTVKFEPNGSGDTTFNYLYFFCVVVLAAAVALVWAIAGRRRANEARMGQWLRIYVRFALAQAMLTYGALKVIQSQFPPPGLGRLIQPFGDASPMGLLWTFMGASYSYNVFTGLAELAGGFLLTMRRTTLLGALLSAGVMSNVAMLNFSYDVPVKLYSVHLLAAAVFLTLPDLSRLAGFFVLNRGAGPAVLEAPVRSRLPRWAVVLGRTAFVALLLYTPIKMSIAQQRRYEAMQTPFQGIWRVDEYSAGGTVVPPMLSEEGRWRRVIFDPGELDIQYVSDVRIRYRLKLDAARHELSLARREEPTKKYTLIYTQPEAGTLVVHGSIEGQNVNAVLHRIESPRFLLLDRGFHWINEYPFNR